MIPRYTNPEMAAVWSEEEKYRIWLEVETLALEQMAKLGICPKSALDAVKSKGKFNVEEIHEIEKEVKHDVIAFLTNVAQYTGVEGRFLHRGMTSSDLLDTTFAVQLKRAGKILLEDLSQAMEAVKEKALKYKDLACMGRSHGIFAEPTTLGLKFLGWYSELRRNKMRLEAALDGVSVGKISGAVGTYAEIPPSVETYVMASLELQADDVSTQVVSRDRHAHFFATLAVIGSSIERFAVEIRHLQRSEVGEVFEAFTKGQKGSSAMPHKRNPILSENITGLSRLLRGYAVSAFENVALWHERDISHSSVERVIAPDACIVADFMLKRFAGIVKGLEVNKKRIKGNLEAARGLYFSGSLLLALVDKGMRREDAYSLVQRNALKAWDEGLDFPQLVKEDSEICNVLNQFELEKVFDLSRYFRHVDYIYERVLEK